MEPGRPPLSMRFKERAWTRVDWALAAICALLVYATMVKGRVVHSFPVSFVSAGSWAPALLLALLVAVPVGLRRRDPVGALLLALTGCVLIIAAGGEISRGAFLALALVLFTVAATRTRTVAVVSLAASLVLLVVQGVILSAIGTGSGPATGVALILIIAWILGVSAQQRRGPGARRHERQREAADHLAPDHGRVHEQHADGGQRPVHPRPGTLTEPHAQRRAARFRAHPFTVTPCLLGRVMPQA